MSESISLFQLMKTFVEAEDKNKSFEIIFVRFEPILNKYALMLKDIDLKYDLAADMYLALLKMPLHEDRFKQDKYIVSYIATTVRHAATKIWKDCTKHTCHSSIDTDDAIDLEDKTEAFDTFWHDATLELIKDALKDDEFSIFILILKGYSQADIAKTLGVTRQAVFKRLEKIKGKIIKVLN